MAELKSRLRADLTQAMKAQDKLRTATLRMLLAAIQTEEVSGKQARELSDDEVIKVLARESRKRGEAAEIYTQNGRGELAANEHAEARIIDEYLPTPLTEAELADVADTAIAAGCRGHRRAAQHEADGTGDEGGHRDRGRQGRRRASVGGGQGAPVADYVPPGAVCAVCACRLGVQVGMTKFGYTLMTEQSGPKDLVRICDFS